MISFFKNDHTGQRAQDVKGHLKASKWLIARRSAQTGFLMLFLSGPLFGIWISKGTLASSLTLNFLPLSDPLITLQSLLAGNIPETTMLIGAAIVLATYLLIGGRMYCSWVCPVNPVTDLAHWTRRKTGLDNKGWQPHRHLRLWILATILLFSAITGTIIWEQINPVTLLHRAIVFSALFSSTMAWSVIAAVFMFDLLIARHGWCGHLCPVGAFYGIVGKTALLRVSAKGRERCDDCMDCFKICPEPQVITPALRGREPDSPVILGSDCTNCGRCIDVCSLDIFKFTHRFNNSTEDFDFKQNNNTFSGSCDRAA